MKLEGQTSARKDSWLNVIFVGYEFFFAVELNVSHFYWHFSVRDIWCLKVLIFQKNILVVRF